MDQGSLLVSDSLLSQSKIQQKLESISSLPDHHLVKIDSLLQAKAQLLQARINHLEAKATSKFQGLDSISNTQATSFLDEKLEDLNPQEYTAKMSGINESLQAHKSKITDSEELAWVEHYSGSHPYIKYTDLAPASTTDHADQ